MSVIERLTWSSPEDYRIKKDKSFSVITQSLALFKAGRNVIGEALARLDEIPLVDGEHVEVPWPTIERPKLRPEQWEESTLDTVPISALFATQKLLTLERVRFYVKNPGAMEEGRRAFANVYDRGGRLAIVDGHHRLAALWLLGADDALVWMLRGAE